jgi:hypothetical protein
LRLQLIDDNILIIEDIMITLSTHASAVALGIDRKSLDNILAREARPLMGIGRRGRSRRVPAEVLERVAIALILKRDLGVTLARGLRIAERVLGSPSSSVTVGSLSTLSFDVPRLRQALELSIGEALESVAERTRGRPRDPE